MARSSRRFSKLLPPTTTVRLIPFLIWMSGALAYISRAFIHPEKELKTNVIIGLLRRYIPTGVSIENYSAEQILSFVDEMNALPRRNLGYSTPEELFEEFLYQVYSVIKVHNS